MKWTGKILVAGLANLLGVGVMAAGAALACGTAFATLCWLLDVEGSPLAGTLAEAWLASLGALLAGRNAVGFSESLADEANAEQMAEWERELRQ
jgi:hypothetical protein